jgi:hypothetical protein
MFMINHETAKIQIFHFIESKEALESFKKMGIIQKMSAHFGNLYKTIPTFTQYQLDCGQVGIKLLQHNKNPLAR